MLVNVLPSAGGRDREMYPQILKANESAPDGPDDQWFSLGSDPSMNLNLAFHQRGNAQSAPDARSPPTRVRTLNPVRRWRRRKGVDDPRFTYMGVQNNSVDFRQIQKELLNLRNRNVEVLGQFGSVRAAPGINKTLNQFVMDKR